MLSPYKDDFRVTSIQRPDRNIGGVIAPHNGIDLVGVNKKYLCCFRWKSCNFFFNK